MILKFGIRHCLWQAFIFGGKGSGTQFIMGRLLQKDN
jgi:hypothetical protein